MYICIHILVAGKYCQLLPTWSVTKAIIGTANAGWDRDVGRGPHMFELRSSLAGPFSSIHVSADINTYMDSNYARSSFR